MRPLRKQSRIEEVPMLNLSIADKDLELTKKLESNQRQSEVKVKTKNKEKIESGDKVETKVETKKEESEDKLESKWRQKTSFSTLSDAEKAIAYFIYEDCMTNGILETKETRVSFISGCLKMPTTTVKKTIQRLEELEHIKRIRFKNGRGGWTVYSLSKDMYDQIRNYQGRFKLETKWSQTRDKLETKVESEVETSTPSSSSSYINTTTNYKADALAKIELNEALVQLGFNQGHVDQLIRDSSLNSELIQSSLDAFAFDLGFEDVKKKVRSPIGLIMKLLKNGQTYISEKGYESEEDRLYRELIERAEKKKEEKLKLESRMAEIKFEEWLENISNEEKRNLVKPIGEFMGLLHRQELKEYFKREVYSANNIN